MNQPNYFEPVEKFLQDHARSISPANRAACREHAIKYITGQVSFLNLDYCNQRLCRAFFEVCFEAARARRAAMEGAYRARCAGQIFKPGDYMPKQGQCQPTIICKNRI